MSGVKTLQLLGFAVFGLGLAACDSSSNRDDEGLGDAGSRTGVGGDAEEAPSTDTSLDEAPLDETPAVGGAGYSEMAGGCEEFPQSFGEVAGAYVQDPQYGRVVQYNAFAGLAEGHASAEGIFEVTLWGKYGAQLEEGEIVFENDDLSYDSCANCVVFHQGARLKNKALSSAEHVFMPAQGGVLIIERLEAEAGGVFKFSLDAQMVEVDMDFEDLSATPKPDGCRFRFEGFTRSIVLEK